MDKILEVKNIKKHYLLPRGVFGSKPGGFVPAVDGVSFSLASGEVLGLVGESGCGKSTLARIIVKLLEPDSGSVFFGGKNITNLSYRKIKQVRKNLQIIFQNPFNSLDPRFTVFDIVSEGLINFSQQKQRSFIYQKAVKALADVGLAEDIINRYPHEFSGGQRQRISIARALVLEPEILVLDEPVSSLDVSIQAQIINLLIDLQRKKGLSYLFIAHDLGVVRHISDKICVMRQGKIVESGLTEQVFSAPSHSYTQNLLASSPVIP